MASNIDVQCQRSLIQDHDTKNSAIDQELTLVASLY